MKRDHQKNLYYKPVNISITQNGKIPYWIYWNNGFGEAPAIVKKCNARLEKMLPSSKYQLHRLDDKVLNQYISLPQNIVNKRNNMGIAYYSDLIRIELLTSYGGIWSDATVYIASPIPNEIIEANFFAFKRNGDIALLSSWFLSAKQSNNILLLWIRHVMHEYWKTHSTYDYCDLHKIFEAIRSLLPIARTTFEMSPWYSAVKAHSLQSIMNKPFNKSVFEMQKSQSFVQKLTYKKKCTFLEEL